MRQLFLRSLLCPFSRRPLPARRAIAGWLLACFFGFHLAAAAPQQALATDGPPGGSVRSLIADPLHPGRFYLGTSTGLIYRSDDDGSHWHFLSRVAGYRNGVVARLAADPHHAGRLWAAVWNLRGPGGGIYLSMDGGRSWRMRFGGHAFHALALAPSDPREVVAGALDGVFASRDGGRRWQRISPRSNRALVNVESVAISPRHAQVIYAGTYHLLWKTFDGGHDWWQMRRGVITDSDIFAIALNPSQPQQVFMSSCSGIYESDNAANQFRKIQGIPYSARRTRAIVPDPRHPGWIYAGTTQGFWKTSNDGANWRRTTTPDLIVNAIALDPRRPGRILLGTDFAGVWASNQGGRSFHPVNRGLAARALAAALNDPASRRFYVAINGNLRWGGVFYSGDQGYTWKHLNRGWPSQATVYRLLRQPGMLLAATDRGLWRYANKRGWLRFKNLPESDVTDVAGAAGYFYAATPRGLWVSSDRGHHWRLRREAPAPAFHVAAARDGQIFVAGRSYVLGSVNRGRQFLTAPLRLRGRVNQIAMQGNHIYVASSDGLYFSLDGGAHWSLAGHGLPQQPVYSVLIAGRRVTAITSSLDVIYISRNAGLSWSGKAAREDAVLLARIGGQEALPWRHIPAALAARTVARASNPAERRQHE